MYALSEIHDCQLVSIEALLGLQTSRPRFGA